VTRLQQAEKLRSRKPTQSVAKPQSLIVSSAMLDLFRTLLFLVCGLLLIGHTALAQDAPTEDSQVERPLLRVATKPYEPFVFENGGQFSGFSIELWDKIADEVGLEYEWVATSSVSELLDTIGDKPTADVATAGITITAAREDAFDFSHPFFHTGLQVLVPIGGTSDGMSTLRAILSPALLKTVGALIAVLLFAAHILWLFERKKNPEMFPSSYVAGVWEAFWWSAVTVTTVGYGDKTPKSIPGRLVAVVWMFAGLLFLGYFTASVTTVLTVAQLTGNINGPDDLMGKSVGTVGGTTASVYLQRTGARVVEFAKIDEAYVKLVDGDLDAVVYDAPGLRYFASHEGRGAVHVVGPLFMEQSYGIGFPEGSPYREDINKALLMVRENGVYEEIYNEYFGER
jgi:polar amino acid transport system substrate-binding protein